MNFTLERTNALAVFPTKGSAQSVGLDLSCVEPIFLNAGEYKSYDIGFKLVCMPEGCYGRIAPRSGLATKGIDVLAGVIDPDYRGPIMVLLHNIDRVKSVSLPQGSRIAQIIFEKASTDVNVSVKDEDSPVVQTEIRGPRGFGSSGE